MAKNVIGPIVLFEEQRRIVSCESDGSAMVGERPIIVDLRGRKTQLPEHPGYLRECERLERSSLLLLHYNLVADGKPYNLIRILSTDGELVLEKTLHESADVSVSHRGTTYRVRIAAPDRPG